MYISDVIAKVREDCGDNTWVLIDNDVYHLCDTYDMRGTSDLMVVIEDGEVDYMYTSEYEQCIYVGSRYRHLSSELSEYINKIPDLNHMLLASDLSSISKLKRIIKIYKGLQLKMAEKMDKSVDEILNPSKYGCKLCGC